MRGAPSSELIARGLAAQRPASGKRLCWATGHAIDNLGEVMQISRPRDLGPLILVIGLLLILLAVTAVVGAPQG